MARTVIDVDDALLEEAAKILGTSKKVATVNAALAEVVKLRKREEFFDALDSGEVDLSYDSRTEDADPRAAA